jgi:hypothetical protein
MANTKFNLILVIICAYFNVLPDDLKDFVEIPISLTPLYQVANSQ